jgi:hypothetical protein
VESGDTDSSSFLILNPQNQIDPQEKILFFVFLGRAFFHRSDHRDYIADHACHDAQDGNVGHALERTGVGAVDVLAVVVRVEVVHSDTSP